MQGEAGGDKSFSFCFTISDQALWVVVHCSERSQAVGPFEAALSSGFRSCVAGITATEIRNAEHLMAALDELGYRAEFHPNGAALAGYEGASCPKRRM